MLIIRRRPGESVLLGDNIEIRVIEISPHRVSLGITAPADLVILRKELQLAGLENLAAARGAPLGVVRAIASRYRRARPINSKSAHPNR